MEENLVHQVGILVFSTL